jgi:hypothetical protein
MTHTHTQYNEKHLNDTKHIDTEHDDIGCDETQHADIGYYVTDHYHTLHNDPRNNDTQQ